MFNTAEGQWDSDFLEWDFHVRALLRKYLAPDHLTTYAADVKIGPEEAKDPKKSADAFVRAQYLLDIITNAIRNKRGIITGGMLQSWLPRAFVSAFLGATITTAALLQMVGVIPGFTPGGPDPTLITTDPNFNTVREVPEESGLVVEVLAAIEVPGATPAGGATPLATVALNIPGDPQEYEPTSDAKTLFENGLAALQQEKFHKAVAYFAAAVEEEPGFVRAYYNLGLAYESLASVRPAVDSYTKAIKLWNSIDEEDDGLLFQAKLARGLLRVKFPEQNSQDVCFGRKDLLEVLADGNPTVRNEEIMEDALTETEGLCVDAVEGAS